MSPKTVTILPPKQRKEVIRENILTSNYEQLAKLCHCTRRTIKRDVQKWREEGGFEQFLIDEFFQSYPNIKEEFPDKAFDRLCYLLGKTITRKVEAKTEVTERLEAKIEIDATKDEEAILNKAAAILNRKLSNKKKLAEVHH